MTNGAHSDTEPGAPDPSGERPGQTSVDIEKGLVVSTGLRVRYGETDQMGVVYHGHYITFMELGRTGFMRSMGVPYASLEARGYLLVVVDASMKLKAGARYDDELTVDTWISRVRHSSITFDYEIRRDLDQVIVATGATRLGCLEAASRKPCAMPEDLADTVKRCLPGESARNGGS